MTYKSLESFEIEEAKRIAIAADSIEWTEYNLTDLFKKLGMDEAIAKGISVETVKNGVEFKFSENYPDLWIGQFNGICGILAYATFLLTGRKGISGYAEDENKCEVEFKD